MGRRQHIGPELITQMRKMRASGMRVKEIAEETGCSCSVVSRHTADFGSMAKWARQESKKCDPVPRRELHWTADKEYQQLLEARQRRRQYPCEHCRWHMNGARDVVCLCYGELWGAGAGQTERKTRFCEAETQRAAQYLGTTPEDAARILALWDNGGGVEDIVRAYENAMGW